MMAWEGQEDAPFNMSMMFYISLNRLIELKQDAYINSDLMNWYIALRATYIKVQFKMAKSEKEKIKDMLNRARNRMRLGLQNRIVSINVSELLEDIDMDITDVMDKRKMIFPAIDLNKMGDLLKRYGLDGK